MAGVKEGIKLSDEKKSSIRFLNYTEQPRYYRMTSGSGCVAADYLYPFQMNRSESEVVVRRS